MESPPSPEKKSISQLDQVALITIMNQLWELYGVEDEPTVLTVDPDIVTIKNLHAEFYINGTYISLTENTEEYLKQGVGEAKLDTITHLRIATPLPYEKHTYWSVDHYHVGDARHVPRLISDETNDKGWWKDYRVSVGHVKPFSPQELERVMEFLKKIQPTHALAEVPEVFRPKDFWAEQQ